jgi:hypothetical protein
MTDLMEQLRQARPTDAELERMWPIQDRAVVLDRVLTDTTTRRTRRKAWLVAAAITGALVVVPGVDDSGNADADFRALAMAAVRTEGPVIQEGTYLHVKTEAIQHNSSIFDDGRTYHTNREMWVRWNGTKWAIDSPPSGRWHDYNVFFRPKHPYVNYPTPEFAASLPDDPDRLRAYLDAHVSGSNSHDEALFVAITDLARSHFMPPETLGAALKVLADVDGVETHNVTVRGRPVVEVTYDRFWGLIDTHTVVLDRATARVIAEHEWNPGGTYDITTTAVEVVDHIPPQVRRQYRQLPNGAGRVYNSHTG